MKSSLFVLLAAAGCASGGSSLGQGDGSVIEDTAQPDSPMQPDSLVTDALVPDAFVPDAFVPDAFVAPDASIDAMADASVTPDACVPVVSQLLLNPSLDLTPMGTNWQQTPFNAMYPLITDQDGAAEHSAPYKAWLGGFVAATAGGTATDVLYQDFVVPAGTTQLSLSYVHIVGTQESASATTAFDTASVAITQTNGTVIANINSFSNLTPVAAWTAINVTVPQNLSGQTVRLRLTSSNDDSFTTNFFFDSFSLTATHCP
ncbi:MAG: hypothetical protein H0T46_35665 [Deltaproteobacteria bacterium]|nr:hypothetical protein [Deltaproteobacteria bacterium]